MEIVGRIDKLTKKLRAVLKQIDASRHEDNPKSAISDFLKTLINAESIDVELEAGYRDRQGSNREIDIVARGVGFEVKKDRKDLGIDKENDAGSQIIRRLKAFPAEDCGWATNGYHWIRWHRVGDEICEDKKFSISRPEESLFSDDIKYEIRDLIETLASDLSPRPAPTGAAVVEVFEPAQRLVTEFSKNARGYESYQIKFELWQEQLRGAHMQVPAEDEGHELFARHSLLTAAARLIAAALSQKASTSMVDRITAAGGFVSWLAWDGAEKELQQQAKQARSAIYQAVLRYDWGKASGDILKHLYHDFIPRKDRHDFGEYYTPDWLAAIVTEEVLDEDYCKQALRAAFAGDALAGLGVLDPGCGSGTFLRAAAKRFLHIAKGMGKSDLQVSNAIAQLVYGFDIHPVAVELAHATLLGVLPEKPTHPLQIYLGDALQLHRESFSMFERDGMLLQIPESDKTILFPQKTLMRNNFEEIIDSIAGADARGEQVARLLTGYHIDDADEKKALREAAQIFQRLRDEGRNGIWAWFIKNLAQPHRLASSQVARIIGNPPWITHNDWRGIRQDDLKNLAITLKVWQGGKSAPQNDLAALFIVRSLKLYWASSTKVAANRFGFVLPGSALKSEAWEKFRAVAWGGANLSITPAWRVETQPRPFPQSASCVVFGRSGRVRALAQPKRMYGDCDNPQFEDIKIYNNEPSDFWDDDKKGNFVRNGATLFPHVLVRVNKKDITEIEPGIVRIKTSLGRHEPWKSVLRQTAKLEEDDLRPALWSNSLLPFRTLDLDRLITPFELRLQEKPNEAISSLTYYWLQAENIWMKHRKEHSPETLEKQIDYMGKLSSQLSFLGNPLSDRVIYNGSGANISATAVSKSNQVIIEHKLYRVATRSLAEAHYLAAILNSGALKSALLASRNNDRDFDSLPFQKIPIRRYNKDNAQHVALAELGKQAEIEAAAVAINEEKTTKSRAEIRNELIASGTMDKINAAVRAILPDYCD